MDLQNILMVIKKLGLLGLIIVSLLFLSCCSMEIPEGEIKDFVLGFDYDKSFEETKVAESLMVSSIYKDGVLEGTITTYTYIDHSESLYHYSKTVVSGSYYGTGLDQFDYYLKETISYIDENGNAIAYEKTDGKIEELTYSPSDIEYLINSFFYTKLEAGYHQGGMYYGDYISANCGKYYECFSLIDEVTLQYQINTSSKDENKQEVITMHKYTVNELGMMLNLSTKSMYRLDTDTYTETKLECDYQSQFEKIYNFN
ncbi:MAG: hypothetical protein IJX78_07560 [Bacilli bacterium]|nr:hypothetical protein [Bacilli bacterium]